MSWQVQSVQAVVFTTNPPGEQLPVSAYELFKSILKVEPASLNNQPGQSQSAGPYAGGILTVSVQSNRYDFTLTPQDQDGDQGPPTFSDPEAPIDAIHEVINGFAPGQNPARVALVINLSEGFKTVEEATQRFSEATQIAVPRDASDLTFALNSKRKLGGAGWEMNRLIRWSTTTLFFVQFEVGNVAMHTPRPQMVRQLANMVVDVNTTPRNIPLGPSQALTAFGELVSEARALIAGGYGRLVDA